MTTHYQKIQALGNRMAENLTIMGVPSQFDEGGLTLADKILEISSGITTGLLLYGDKKVAQSGDTVNLSMMVLEDGEFQPNTNVILHETILDKTYSAYSSISKSIGDNWVIEGPFENIISSSDTSGTTITAWGNGKLTVSVGGATVYHDSEAGSISKISYINKILSYNNKTVDLTEYNASFNVLSNVNAGRIIVKTAYVLTTDTHGLATHAYTCSGSGLREFYATSGTFVSETLPVLDTLLYDTGTDATHNIWTGDTSNLTRNSEYSRLEESASPTATAINTVMPTGLWVLTMTVKKDGLSGEWNINILNNNVSVFGCGTPANDVWTDITLVYDGSFIYYFENGSTTPTKKTSVMLDESKTTTLRLQTPQSITYVDFKDLIVLREGMSNISIGSSNPIIQSGDTTTINGSLYESGLIVKNATLDVYKNGSKVGTASTGDSGVASYTYTGVADGEVEFQFKYGSVVSETYKIIDGLLTVISEETFDGVRSYNSSPSDSGYDWETPFCVEFDVKSNSNTSNQRLRVYDNSGENTHTWVSTLDAIGISNTDYHHIKLIANNNGLTYQLDNNTPIPVEKTFTSKCRVNWTIYGANTPSTSVKNFVIYPI